MDVAYNLSKINIIKLQAVINAPFRPCYDSKTRYDSNIANYYQPTICTQYLLGLGLLNPAR